MPAGSGGHRLPPGGEVQEGQRPSWPRLGFLLLALCAPVAASAQEAFITQLDAALRPLPSLSPDDARAACAQMVEATFDMPALAQAVAVEGVATADVGAALRERFVANCVRNRREERLVFLGLRGESVVSRLDRPDGTERVMVWRLQPGGPWGWRAVDVSVEGVGQAARLRDELRGRLAATGDPDAALAGFARRGAP